MFSLFANYLKFTFTDGPEFVKEPEDFEVIRGQSTTLDCLVQGHPHPFITWYQNEVQISHGDTYHILANGSLWIKEVQKWQDKELFTCEASSEAGVVTASAGMIVLGKTLGDFFFCSSEAPY